jgi:cytoskeleton protein RodZ
VRVTARQDAWVDVRQADGKSLFIGTLKAGSPLEVSGTAPFALTIGNADKVSVEYQGQAVTFKPAQNNIARIKLP